MIENTEYLLTLLKTVIYGCSFFSPGILLFLLIFPKEITCIRSRLYSFIIGISLAGIVLLIINFGTQIIWLSDGDPSALHDPDMLSLILSSSTGKAQLFLALGFVCIILASKINHPAFSFLVLAIVPITYALSGHTGFYSPTWLLKIFILLHLSIACFWIGSFVPLLIVINEKKETASEALERFGTIATFLVPILLVTGLGMAWLIAGGIKGLTTDYGLALLGKAGIVTLLLCFAALNKLSLVPQFRKDPAQAAKKLKRSIRTEIVLVLVILAFTSTITTIIPPENLGHRLG
jgi:copper resistance protein D